MNYIQDNFSHHPTTDSQPKAKLELLAERGFKLLETREQDSSLPPGKPPSIN